MRIARTIRLLAVLAFAASGAAAFAQTPDNLAGYAGRYSGFAGSPNYIDVTLQDGALRFQPTGQSAVPATAQPDGKFKLENVPPGAISMRVEAGGYMTHVASGEVRANDTTKALGARVRRLPPRRRST